MPKQSDLITTIRRIEARQRKFEELYQRAFDKASAAEIEDYMEAEYQEQLASQPAFVSSRMLTVESDTKDHPLDDPSSPIKIVSKMRFEVDLEVISKTVERAVASIVKKANQQNHFSNQPEGALYNALYSVTEELPNSLRKEVITAVKRARRKAYEQAVQETFGVLHKTTIETSVVKKPRANKPWSSGEELRAALYRAIKAIEYEGWQPPKNTITKSRLVNKGNKNKAEWEMVVAYWDEVESHAVADDSKTIDRWLKKEGLPNFSQLRDTLREEIEADKNNSEEAIASLASSSETVKSS